MKFTERGSKVLISRSGSDEAGGAQKESVGILRKPDYDVGEELRSKLTPEELREVEAYVTRARRSSTVDQEYAVVTFVDNLAKVSNWLKSADPEEVKAFHEKVRKPLTKLRRQFAAAAGGSGDKDGNGED